MENKLKNGGGMIWGCGDIGHRIAFLLQQKNIRVQALVRSVLSQQQCEQRKLITYRSDIDSDLILPKRSIEKCAAHFYFIPPSLKGGKDLRSRRIVSYLSQHDITLKEMLVISTTAVYGDTGGQWVDETSPTEPNTPRGKRRLDSEQVWSEYCQQRDIPLSILRVPSIYAYSRLPFARLKRQTPVVKPSESGYSNRIHADDLAMACIFLMCEKQNTGCEIYNISDGNPSTMADFLQASARYCQLPMLPEITLEQAKKEYSETLLSYVTASRKINSRKILRLLPNELRYPDYRLGLQFG